MHFALRYCLTENCRWLFNQEVRIITFYSHGTGSIWPSSISRNHTTIPDKPVSYIAIVLPALCSSETLAQPDINEQILIKSEYPGKMYRTSEEAIDNLLEVVEKRIGDILNVDARGKLQTNNTPRTDRSSYGPQQYSLYGRLQY